MRLRRNQFELSVAAMLIKTWSKSTALECVTAIVDLGRSERVSEVVGGFKAGGWGLKLSQE